MAVFTELTESFCKLSGIEPLIFFNFNWRYVLFFLWFIDGFLSVSWEKGILFNVINNLCLYLFFYVLNMVGTKVERLD